MIIQFKQNVGHYAVITIKEDISGHIVQNCMWTKYVTIILIVLGFFWPTILQNCCLNIKKPNDIMF